MKQGIYQIKNLINNKKYIGQSIHIEKRWFDHKRCYEAHLESSPLLYQAFKKYGVENFEFSILEEVENRDLLNERESYYIQSLNTLSPNGYNCILPDTLLKGEENLKNKLSLDEVQEIKTLLTETEVFIEDISKQFNITPSTVYRINRGEI